jgi:predicted DNA-binding protein
MAIKKTSIQLSFETKRELDNIGKKGETYEDIIKRLLELSKQAVKLD